MSAKGKRLAALTSAASALSLDGGSVGSGASSPRSVDDSSTITADTGATGLTMKEKAALRKAAKAALKKDEEKVVVAVAHSSSAAKLSLETGSALPESTASEKLNAAARSATGVLVSEKRARDIKIIGFSLSLHSSVLVEDTTIEMNCE